MWIRIRIRIGNTALNITVEISKKITVKNKEKKSFSDSAANASSEIRRLFVIMS
jgi:hypothetical protein